MKKLYQDKRINKENIHEFNTRGWTLVDLNLSKKTIEEATLGLKKMRFDAIKNDYKARRIYFDHLLTNNLAAIELPFNKTICNKNIKSLFTHARIGSLVKTLMGWEKPCCDLARLFCMRDFKYRTIWHRDYDADLWKIHRNSNSRDIILVGIYLLPQKGFRILKKEYEFNGNKSIVCNRQIDNAIRSFPFSLSPPKESFYEIDGKIGTALLFDPLLLHQGSSFQDRLDFHLKFVKSKNNIYKKNSFQDFNVIDVLHENYIFQNSTSLVKGTDLEEIPFMKRSTLFNRALNSLDYRTGIKTLLKLKSYKLHPNYKLIKKSGWELDFFSNTFLQK